MWQLVWSILFGSNRHCNKNNNLMQRPQAIERTGWLPSLCSQTVQFQLVLLVLRMRGKELPDN